MTEALFFDSSVEHVYIDEESFLEHKELLRSDAWPFALAICGFDRLIERFHRPLLYLLVGDHVKLLAFIRESLRAGASSEPIDQIVAYLEMRDLSVFNLAHEHACIEALKDAHNLLLFRGSGKTSVETAAITYLITIDPNECIALFGGNDDTAEEIGGDVAKIILSDVYQEWFPERIPNDVRANVTASYILLAGRTRTEFKEPCLLAMGHRSGWTSRHFTRIFFDDVITNENSSSGELRISMRILSNVDGLHMNEVIWPPGVPESNIGTVWSRFDFGSRLADEPDCVTIRVPIWRRADGKSWTVKNYLEDGVPTLPEWTSVESIRKRRKKTRRDPDQGVIAWFCNFLMIAMEDGMTLFHPDVVDRAKFMWFDNPRRGRREVMRPATKMDRSPLYNDEGQQLYFYFDPLRMKRVIAVDQARSSDLWAIAVIAIDHQGFRYVLEVVAGRGYNQMLDALVEVDERWDFPAEIGIEGGSMQGITIDWMRREDEFQSMAGRVVEIKNWNRAKERRIREHVAAPMETGELLLNPDDTGTRREARQYNPDDKEPKDNRLDAIAMGSHLLDTPGEDTTAEEEEKFTRRRQQKDRDTRDADTGIEIVNWWDRIGA